MTMRKPGMGQCWADRRLSNMEKLLKLWLITKDEQYKQERK